MPPTNENVSVQANPNVSFGNYQFPPVWATSSYGHGGPYELQNINGPPHAQPHTTFNSNTNVLSQILAQPVAHLEYSKMQPQYQGMQMNQLSVGRVQPLAPLDFGNRSSGTKSNSTVSPTESGTGGQPQLPPPPHNISSRGRKRRATRAYSPEDLSADEEAPRSTTVKTRTFKNEDERTAYQTRREKNNEAARLSRLRRREREKQHEMKAHHLEAETRYWHAEFVKIATPEQHQRVVEEARRLFAASPIL
ncbi:hypothetical protein M3Y94_00209200 [Aphelenchoides besseyi]|nr:hypothetical protein M3Y94_00209200 [Aphelenchoides besseyi]KAI6236639.1 hypothetical protein M3Y95_00179000 [Aphelenchoides besseyi]